MLRKLLFLFTILAAGSGYLYSQTVGGTLKGKITDKDTKEVIAYAAVVIESGGKNYGGAQSDEKGYYTIKPIPVGIYDVKADFVGYHEFTIKGVVISADKITELNIQMVNSNKLKEVIVTYQVPLIDKDHTEDATTMTADQIEKLPSRSAQAVEALTPGVTTDLNGNVGGIRGQRADGTNTYIDGVRVGFGEELPQSAIDQVSVVTGGIPAQYGDVTGGIVNITSKGPTRTWAGGGQLETQADYSHSSLVGFNLMGPLIYGKDTTKSTSLLGFFLAGQFTSGKAGPSAIPEYTVNPTLRASIEQNPLQLSGTGVGAYPRAEFLTQSDLVPITSKDYSLNQGLNLSTKIDVRTTNTTTLTLGGRFGLNGLFGNAYDYNRGNLLLNDENNAISPSNEWSTYVKFTQRFPQEKDSKSLIKNVYYTIQADYTHSHGVTEDANHLNNLFQYGYIGKFTEYSAKSYASGVDPILKLPGKLENAIDDTLVTFKQADINRLIGNYTEQYFNMFPKNEGYYTNFTNIENTANGGLLNGDAPPSVYGLWNNTGAPSTSNYSESTSSQIEINATGSADIGNHAIQFGILYQQNTYRYYTVNAYGLWTLMEQDVNKHIQQLDFSNPHAVYDAYHVYQDTIWYNRLNTQSEQASFDYNLRKNMGLPTGGTDYIDINSYDMNSHEINYYSTDQTTGKYIMHTATLSQDLNMNWFSADDLINQGHSYVSYYGYDYAGNILKTNPTLDDFFTQKDANGNYTRQIAPFQPIYMAGYIQDKFAFNDLIFNIGVRVDRYDLNQPVLKDPYLFYPAYTVGDVLAQQKNGGSEWAQIPSSVGSNYVVYVDNVKDPTTVTGFRNGNTWYNAQGTVVSSPTLIASNGNIQPYLVNPDNQVLSSAAFQSYTPQTTVMPRIAFSFPISDEALFFAHYDILTNRPTVNANLDLLGYLSVVDETSGQNFINNPNLQPQRTTDYELGFQQKLSSTSSLKISGFYREIRDLIQSYGFFGAYPNTYYSYSNIDFGTVKGMVLSYELRRSKNVSIEANYTLQFANGTGSDQTTSQGLVLAGEPNLRSIYPLSYDQRHQIKVSLDYRFSEGADYNGPVITKKVKGKDEVKTLRIFENAGINLAFRGLSGFPYTVRNIVGNAIEGSINGARYPWAFAADLRIDKDFSVKWKKGNKSKATKFNAYILVYNLFNTKNIMYVYPTTGNPNDDGYLTAAQNQNIILSQIDAQSYRDLYSLYINNPTNYTNPRAVRIGIQFGL